MTADLIREKESRKAAEDELDVYRFDLTTAKKAFDVQKTAVSALEAELAAERKKSAELEEALEKNTSESKIRKERALVLVQELTSVIRRDVYRALFPDL